jgi:hypothetical protein
MLQNRPPYLYIMSLSSLERTKIGPIVFVLTVVLAIWLVAEGVLRNATYLLVPVSICAVVFALFQTFKNWRIGMILFIAWMLFEDLARKYLGNNMAVYFGKDALAAACYLSFFITMRRERRLIGRPAFFIPFMALFGWCLIESVNLNSPSPWYGVLGVKLYFGYVPFFFLGYAFLRNEYDLRKFLLVNLSIAGLIAALGTAQSISGQALLAPADLAPDISLLGTLTREAPLTHEIFIRPTSVFVSEGRFSSYLLLVWILGFGTATYFLAQRLPGRKWVVAVTGLFFIAIILSGSRGALIYSLLCASIIFSVFAREMLWTNTRVRKIGIGVATILVLTSLAVVFLATFDAEALNPRVAFYQQTLSPSSPTSELGWRAWGYPLSEFSKAFEFPYWVFGSGIGTHSLGTQYVARILDVPPITEGVESGYGNLMLEVGIPGLLLWLVFSATLIASSWNAIRRLRGTPLFPIGFVIFVFVFLVLFPSMAGGLSFENFVINAYLCILLGVLLSLPALLETLPLRTRPSRLGDSLPRVRTMVVGTAAQPVRKSMNFQS